jgi:hypothetical protein
MSRFMTLPTCGPCRTRPIVTCCDPNVYGYVKRFTLDDILVEATGDPDVFDVTINAFTLNRQFTGSAIEAAIGVHDYVADADPYFVDYLATPVTDFTFQLSKNVDDELIFRVMLPTKTNDGMLFFGFVYGTVDVSDPEAPVVTLTQVEDLTMTIVCNSTVALEITTNGGTNIITYHAIQDEAESVETYTTPILVTANAIAFFNNNSNQPIDTEHFTAWGEFVPTCNGPVTFLTSEFACENDTMQITVGAFGLAYTDVVTVEVSNDGGSTWTEFYTAPMPNGTNQEEEHPEWNHELFPDGEEVIIRIMSADLGELRRVTTTVSTCEDPLVVEINDIYSYDCNSGTIALDYVLSGGNPATNYVLAFAVNSTPERTWGEAVLPGAHSTFSVFGPGAIANGTYTITVTIDGEEVGSHELIISCP